jgi:uncharacterized protein YegP (UPF0339 family)
MENNTEILRINKFYYFVLAQNQKRWDWFLFASNGTFLARSGKSYGQKKDCVKMLRKLFGFQK